MDETKHYAYAPDTIFENDETLETNTVWANGHALTMFLPARVTRRGPNGWLMKVFTFPGCVVTDVPIVLTWQNDDFILQRGRGLATDWSEEPCEILLQGTFLEADGPEIC